MSRPVQGDLYGILSRLLRKSRNSKLIFEYKEKASQDAILQDEEKMKEINEKMEKMGSSTTSIRNDLSKGNMILSEVSSRSTYEMGNMELSVPEGWNMCHCGVWLRPNQRTMDRIRTALAALNTPYCSASIIISRGKIKWSPPMATRSSNKSHGCIKKSKCTSILDRWQNDEVYRASQLVYGWTDAWVKYLDYISKIDISHDAPYRQRLRYESTVYMRGVDPVNMQDHCVSDLIINHQQMLQSAFNELKEKEYLRFQCICGQGKITHCIPQSNIT